MCILSNWQIREQLETILLSIMNIFDDCLGKKKKIGLKTFFRDETNLPLRCSLRLLFHSTPSSSEIKQDYSKSPPFLLSNKYVLIKKDLQLHSFRTQRINAGLVVLWTPHLVLIDIQQKHHLFSRHHTYQVGIQHKTLKKTSSVWWTPPIYQVDKHHQT